MFARFYIADAEHQVKRLREHIADQQAVVELLELRGYNEPLGVATRYLDTFERLHRSACHRLEQERRRAADAG